MRLVLSRRNEMVTVETARLIGKKRRAALLGKVGAAA